MSKEYENLSREALVEILKRRDAQATYGLVWEKEDIDPDSAVNKDFVGLALDTELSCGEGPWNNLIIEGDNYDALRNLVSTYAGQATLIYIDPPYNTGSKDFVYNDHYFDSTDRFKHSTWLEFMCQRLWPCVYGGLRPEQEGTQALPIGRQRPRGRWAVRG